MKIYLISPPTGNFLDALPSLLIDSVKYFQYRRPERNDLEQFEELKKVRRITRERDTKLLVNDRPDLALTVNAEGVHLGEQDLPVEDVKDEWPSMVVGWTQRHDKTIESRADYLSVGPVFDPFSKSINVEPCGWEGVRGVIEKSARPVYAIGGLTPERIKNAPDGLAGVAVIGTVWQYDEPIERLKVISSLLQGS